MAIVIGAPSASFETAVKCQILVLLGYRFGRIGIAVQVLITSRVDWT
jgi:hypothetical protein